MRISLKFDIRNMRINIYRIQIRKVFRMKEQKEAKKGSSTKNFFALLKKLKWPIGVMVVALILSLVTTVAGLVIPLITKTLVDTLSSALFNWKTAAFLFVIFIVQAIDGWGIALFIDVYRGNDCRRFARKVVE